MSAVVQKMRPDASGMLVSEGGYAVHPDGHVIVVPPLAPLKDGFRWATQADVESALHSAPVVAEPEPAHEPTALERFDAEESQSEEHSE